MNAPTQPLHLMPEINQRTTPQALIDALKARFGERCSTALVDWALKQAWKESNYQNNAYNSCCYGLYQLNFNAHKTWLARCGVTTPSQLFDPRVNTEMAVIVFRRMGGQGPWTGPIPCA